MTRIGWRFYVWKNNVSWKIYCRRRDRRLKKMLKRYIEKEKK